MHDFTFIKKNERLTDRTTGNNNSSLGLGIACNRFAIHLRIAATLPRFPSRSQTPLHSAWPVSLRAPKNGRTPLHPFRSALTDREPPLFPPPSAFIGRAMGGREDGRVWICLPVTKPQLQRVGTSGGPPECRRRPGSGCAAADRLALKPHQLQRPGEQEKSRSRPTPPESKNAGVIPTA